MAKPSGKEHAWDYGELRKPSHLAWATVAVDVARTAFGSPIMAYSTVFAGEAVLFVLSAIIAWQVAPNVAIGSNEAAHEAELEDALAEQKAVLQPAE